MTFDCQWPRPMSEVPAWCVHTVAARPRLRSADHADLVVPRALTTRCGSRSFRIAGPLTWNGLPSNIRSASTWEQFKRSLKSWLFEWAYDRRRVWDTFCVKTRLTNLPYTTTTSLLLLLLLPLLPLFLGHRCASQLLALVFLLEWMFYSFF